jgi:hypothetical protein
MAGNGPNLVNSSRNAGLNNDRKSAKVPAASNMSSQHSIDSINNQAGQQDILKPGDILVSNPSNKKNRIRNKNSDNYLETIRENERLGGGAKSQAERH